MKSINYDKELLIIKNYIGMDRYPHALEHLSLLLEENPSDAYLIYLYSYCLYHSNKYPEALSSCKDAFDNGYPRDDCYYLFSQIYTQTDQYKEAENSILSALEIAPQTPDFLAFYGYLMMLMKKDYKALELINEALKIDPENISALHYKFYYYLHMEDTDGIKSGVVEKYFSLSSNECDRFLKAGLLDYYNYNYDSASENFVQAFQLDPTNKFVLKMLERVNQKPRFLFHWKRLARKFIMSHLALARVRLRAKWILFKCVGITRDTLIFVTAPLLLLLLIIAIILAIII